MKKLSNTEAELKKVVTYKNKACSDLFFSDASLQNQYKFIAFNIFSCKTLIIYCKILIITVISNKATNELIIYANLRET